MNLLGWNCWEIGNPRIVGALREYVRQWDPKVVFLSETKMKINKMKRVKEKINFANGFHVQREGKGGGLAMFWRKEMNLEIKSFFTAPY